MPDHVRAVRGAVLLKPQTADYPQVPENEDLTMRLAAQAGIDVPLHGLVYGREGRRRKLHVEDFAQLAGRTRETKYRASMEQVAETVERFCTFPAVERVKLFRRTLFSFLVGNEDLHLKNFSLIHRGDVVTLSPAYDLVSTTIVLPHPEEEFALPLRGKKRRLQADDLVAYFGRERLRLPGQTAARVSGETEAALPLWEETVARSFLSDERKERYLGVVRGRRERLFG